MINPLNIFCQLIGVLDFALLSKGSLGLELFIACKILFVW